MCVCIYVCMYVYLCACMYVQESAVNGLTLHTHPQGPSHCNILQHTATHYTRTLDCTATHCNTLLYAATHCNTLQHTATHCNTLQRTAAHCICDMSLGQLCPLSFDCESPPMDHLEYARCKSLQHTATHAVSMYVQVYAPPQNTATHCNTPQHTATHVYAPLNLTLDELASKSAYLCQHVATHSLQHTHCNTLQHAHCNTLHCNTWQHTAT